VRAAAAALSDSWRDAGLPKAETGEEEEDD
jgi:hypothetical protein